jgi:hypothetical protein
MILLLYIRVAIKYIVALYIKKRGVSHCPAHKVKIPRGGESSTRPSGFQWKGLK